MARHQDLEINEQFYQALDLMSNTDQSLFITGKAGTGKSTLLEYFYATTEKNVVILAPTGVAALNVKGQTIHNFFNFYIDVTPDKIRRKEIKPKDDKLYKKLTTIIIDEVSMVRADLLDCIDVFLRIYGPSPTQAFGGVQMIFIGDLYQLPPVVTSEEKQLFSSYYTTPYFFSSQVLKDLRLEMIELEKVYRQTDKNFVELLNRIRNNSVEPEDIERLNSRFIEGWQPATTDFYINLTTTNQKADEINDIHLQALNGQSHNSSAKITGSFGKEYFPTATELQFKVGAQVMLLNNDQKKRWVNGTIGIIEAVKIDEEKGEYVNIRLHCKNRLVQVYPYTWELYRFSFDGKAIISEPIGTFIQYPFRLAWAITIHKSQGKTFDQVVIDIGKGTFASGQMYVALSRCRSFEGIILKTEVKKSHIRTDSSVFKFLTGYHYQKSHEAFSIEDKMEFIRQAINEKLQLNMVYLKANDTKSQRVIQPLTVGIESYQGKQFPGMKAFCAERAEEKMFHVGRILKLEKLG